MGDVVRGAEGALDSKWLLVACELVDLNGLPITTT